MTKEERYLNEQGLERQYGVIDITFEGLEEHLKMFNYQQTKELTEEVERQEKVTKTEQTTPKEEFSFDDVMEANGIESRAPKWLGRLGIGLVIEVLIAGIVLDCYGVYKLAQWIF